MSAFGSDLGADLGSGLGAALGSNCGSKEGCACGPDRRSHPLRLVRRNRPVLRVLAQWDLRLCPQCLLAQSTTLHAQARPARRRGRGGVGSDAHVGLRGGGGSMGFNLGSTEPGLIGPPFGTCLGVVGLVEPVRAVWLIVRVDTLRRLVDRRGRRNRLHLDPGRRQWRSHYNRGGM
jgi:hypothetical protein